MHQLLEFTLNHWVLWSLFFVILFLLLATESSASKQQGDSLSPHEAVAKMNHDNATVIDLRDKTQFEQGHITDAQCKTKDNLLGNNKFKNKAIILVCKNGDQSQTTRAALKKAEYEKVFVLKGGMQAWQEASLPVVKG